MQEKRNFLFNIVMTLFRSTSFITILILAAGALISGENIAALGGIIACFMLTASSENIKNTIKVSSWLYYLGAVAIFLIFAYIDMKF